MKVLIVSQNFWPETFQINNIVDELLAKGIEVDVLTGKPNYPDGQYFPGYRGLGCQREQYLGANVYRVPLAKRGSRSAIGLAANYLSFVIAGTVCGSWMLRRRRYNAIFVYATSPVLQAMPALFLGLIKRTKVILWVQDLWPESLEATGYVKNRFMLSCVEKVVRFIYARADLILVQSRGFLESIHRLAPGKDVAYHPNSSNVAESFVATSLRSELACVGKDFSVVFTGNVGAAQAMDVIVDAATLLRERPGINFIIVGTGSRWDWLRAEVTARGLANVFLPGRFPNEDMSGVMQNASVLLVALTDESIFSLTVPNKIQAYMAAGRPILASLNGEGARLIEEAHAGVAVPAGDSKALADAVLTMSEMSSSERDEIGKNGRAYYKAHFDRSKLINQLVAYFE